MNTHGRASSVQWFCWGVRHEDDIRDLKIARVSNHRVINVSQHNIPQHIVLKILPSAKDILGFWSELCSDD